MLFFKKNIDHINQLIFDEKDNNFQLKITETELHLTMLVYIADPGGLEPPSARSQWLSALPF